MTLATVPVGVMGLAVYGCFATGVRREGQGVSPGTEAGDSKNLRFTPPASPLICDPRLTLFVAAVLVPLALVCTRGESLYDGVRLWLVVFPPLALLCGRGAGLLYERLERWRPKLAAPAVIGLLAVQGVNLVWMSPVWLSSYSVVVGGLWGADRLGFERNYWGDAVTRDLLAAADTNLPGDVPIAVAPALHQFAAADFEAASRTVRANRAAVVAAAGPQPPPPIDPALLRAIGRSHHGPLDGFALVVRTPFGAGFQKGYRSDLPTNAGTVRFARLAYWNAGPAERDVNRQGLPSNPGADVFIERPAQAAPVVLRRQGVVLAVVSREFLLREPLPAWANSGVLGPRSEEFRRRFKLGPPP